MRSSAGYCLARQADVHFQNVAMHDAGKRPPAASRGPWPVLMERSRSPRYIYTLPEFLACSCFFVCLPGAGSLHAKLDWPASLIRSSPLAFIYEMHAKCLLMPYALQFVYSKNSA